MHVIHVHKSDVCVNFKLESNNFTEQGSVTCVRTAEESG